MTVCVCVCVCVVCDRSRESRLRTGTRRGLPSSSTRGPGEPKTNAKEGAGVGWSRPLEPAYSSTGQSAEALLPIRRPLTAQNAAEAAKGGEGGGLREEQLPQISNQLFFRTSPEILCCPRNPRRVQRSKICIFRGARSPMDGLQLGH